MGMQIDFQDNAGGQDSRDSRLAAAGFDAAHEQRLGLARHGAAGQPFGAVALTGGAQRSGADLLEPRLFAMLSNAGAAQSLSLIHI